MTRLARLILFLITGLALLTVTASGVIQTTVERWFERDVKSRAQLVLVGSQQSLTDAWFVRDSLRYQLQAIARDERVIGVEACGTDFKAEAVTTGFPPEFTCTEIGSRLRTNVSTKRLRDGELQVWNNVATLPAGRVLVTSMAVMAQNNVLGYVVLVHDLAYIDKRESAAQSFLFGAFGLLALFAFGVPLVVARRARTDWSTELSKVLRGKSKQSREFQPVLNDMRELVAQMHSEREDASGAWSAARLRQVLNRYLQGEKVVILANREPYLHQRMEDGTIQMQHPASGLVTALEPVMRACSGVWVAHGSGSADRETVDRHDRVRVGPEGESYHIRRVWLTDEEQQGYYYGFSNEGLWPLCHVAHARPIFRAEDWRQYKAVNQKFADAVCREVDSKDPIILVQDYHFAMAPAMIRAKLPAATVIMFWHIPWPNGERIGMCPWRHELLEGVLGSSILGFHTQLHCNNFLDSVDRYLETRIDREQNAVVRQGRRTLVRPYPISLEWPVHWAEESPPAEECRAEVWRRFKLKPDALLGIGVDRLDYTKGIEERLLAVEMLLERYSEFRGRFSFVQIAAPSRVKIERYQQLNDTVERLAARINQRFGSAGYLPIILLREHHEPPDVFRYYRAADLCYVSSLHDGMNLVAKEFVAAREDLKGVLVLSEFTGAARELTEALVVNPYDLEASSEAMAVALRMPEGEQSERMMSMRSILMQFNVYRWAGKMLGDAARVRSQERLTGQWGDRLERRTDILR